MDHILITGACGFIGFHLARRLLNEGIEIVGIDNLNDYYDVRLKEARLSQLQDRDRFKFIKVDLENRKVVEDIFNNYTFDIVVHLAAQAGVRYSLEDPYSYIDSNLSGFLPVLEGCRKRRVKHLVFASSSSVYGANKKIPFSPHHGVDHPVSLYGATKRAVELMAHSYSSLFKIPSTGLRFFTVYGPWGRPDMAYYKFTKGIVEGKPIDVYNYGKMKRDFTYIDDIIEGVLRVMQRPPEQNSSWDGSNPDPCTSFAPYRIYNIGNNKSVDLSAFISILEKELDKKAEKNFLPLQPGDIVETCADISDIIRDVGFEPRTSIEEGIKRFIEWFRDYYKI